MHMRIRLGVAFSLIVACVLHAEKVRAQGSVQTWAAKSAAKYLDGRADWWLGWSSAGRGQGTACISCHTTLSYALARPALGARLGETEAGAVEKALLEYVKKRVEHWDKIVGKSTDKDPFRPFYDGARKPSALGTESVVNALVLVNHDVRRGNGVLGDSTKKALGHLWGQQQADGAWLWLDFGLRPWETEAPHYGASLAALAIGMAGPDYYNDSVVRPKVTALKKYLVTQLPNQRLHHRMVALWASSRLPGLLSAEDRKNLVDEILNQQETDGGWTSAKLGKYAAKKGDWTSFGVTQTGAVSDGYATGLAVLALKSAAVPAENAKLQKGTAWLVAQQKDGVWPATYLNKARDSETDVGKFMRDAASAFAVLALTETK